MGAMALFARPLFVRKVLGSADSVAASFNSAAPGAIPVAAGANSAAEAGGASGRAVAIIEFTLAEATGVFDDPLADEVEAGAAESEAEDGVEAEADGNPRSSAATVDTPKNANNMAAMASLTSLPLT
jgi:hypothetical protein